VRAIVTVVNDSYRPLLNYWLPRVHAFSDLPIFVLISDAACFFAVQRSIARQFSDRCYVLDCSGCNAFPNHSAENAAIHKLLLFCHLPCHISSVLFLDIDTILLERLSELDEWFEIADQGSLCACLDKFVGYKERLVEEVAPIDPTFSPRFLRDGSLSYINSGVFVASRFHHASILASAAQDWLLLFGKTGYHPSILDQQMLNYRLTKSAVQIHLLRACFNCLRTDYPSIEMGRLVIDCRPVAVYHLNGGSPEVKMERWIRTLRRLHSKAID